jgi:hypothetical protein
MDAARQLVDYNTSARGAVATWQQAVASRMYVSIRVGFGLALALGILSVFKMVRGRESVCHMPVMGCWFTAQVLVRKKHETSQLSTPPSAAGMIMLITTYCCDVCASCRLQRTRQPCCST